MTTLCLIIIIIMIIFCYQSVKTRKNYRDSLAFYPTR